MPISYIADPEITKVIEETDWSQFQQSNGSATGNSGRTANSDGNKTGGGGKGWAGLNSFADFMHNLLGGNTTNYVTNETGSSKMSAGVWIAIGGVLLVVVVLVVVLATRNK